MLTGTWLTFRYFWINPDGTISPSAYKADFCATMFCRYDDGSIESVYL